MPRVAIGIYRDRYGYRVVWRDRGAPREKRFPPDTPLVTLKSYRARQCGFAQQSGETPSRLARDVAGFLKLRKSLPTWKSDRAHLRVWLNMYPRLTRWTLTRAHVQQAIAQWEAAGYAAREIRHRVRVLKQLYITIDPDSPTPCDRVRLPSVPKPRPVPVRDELVRTVALNLRASEILGRLRNAQTRARYLVLATTGQRPAQMMRARPDDVQLDQRVWIVRPAKGDRGTLLALNADMIAAWQLFITAKAWGRYDHRSFVKVLHRNGWPKGIRPYTLRHSVGMALSAANVDLGDIQGHMGHSSPETTRAYYVPGLLERQQVASTAIEGRLTVNTATAFSQHGTPRKRHGTQEHATIRHTRKPLKTVLREQNVSKIG